MTHSFLLFGIHTSFQPTSEPTSAPTNVSTNVPTALPTNEPTTLPTKMPTKEPTSEPTLSPVPVTPTTSPTPVVRSVATTLHGGLKQAGMMFDVRVPSVEEGGPPEGLTVIAFEVSTFLTSDMCVEVYHKNGTHVGFETDVKKNEDGTWSSPSWRSIGAAATQGAGDDAPTHLPVGSVDQVFIPPGETHAFYVTMQTPELRYTQPKFGEKTGDIFSGSPDGHLELLVGAAKSYPFMDTWPDRIFNGAVLYHLGDVLDASEYGGLTADERNYSCSAPVAPTMRPTTDTLNSNATTPSVTRPPTALGSVSRPPTDPGANETRPSEGDASKPPTPAQTAATRPPSPSVVEDQVPASSPDASQTTRPRLVGSCPSSTDTTDSESSGQQAIVVQYEYELVTDLTVDLRDVILGIENVVHGNLIAQKCAQDRLKDLRMLQETSNTSTTSYLGFNSDPVDAAMDKNCANVAALADNEVCTVIKGGLTASTKDGVDDTIVQEEINLFIEGLLSDSTNYDETGAKQVIVQSDDLGETGSGTDRGTDISEAQKEIDQGTATDGSDGLSTAATIAISVVGGVVLIALVLLLAMLQNRRKKVKMESMRELFDDEELEEESPEELGQGYSDNKDASYPSTNNSSVASSSLFPPDDEEMTSMEKSSSPAVILNDQDEASLISNTESKMMPFHVAPQPVSSSIEKEQYGSVEFIRAGESFGSRARSYQPEDTVDL